MLSTTTCKVPYSDQFSIGMRNKVGDWNTSATCRSINSYKDGLACWATAMRIGSFATRVCGLDRAVRQPVGPGRAGLRLADPRARTGIENTTTQFLVSAEKPYTRESHGVRRSPTRTPSATQNRLYIDEHYAFDLRDVSNYPFIALERGREASPRRDRQRRWSVGPAVLRQADAGDADSG